MGPPDRRHRASRSRRTWPLDAAAPEPQPFGVAGTAPENPAAAASRVQTLVADGTERHPADAETINRVARRNAEPLLGRMRAGQLPDANYPLVKLTTDVPPERTLYADASEYDNEAKINDVAGPRSLVASGGVCGPLSSSWDVLNFSVTDRPVRDSLVSFAASRGGVRLIMPPRLTDTVGPSSGVSLWKGMPGYLVGFFLSGALNAAATRLALDVELADGKAPKQMENCWRTSLTSQAMIWTTDPWSPG